MSVSTRTGSKPASLSQYSISLRNGVRLRSIVTASGKNRCIGSSRISSSVPWRIRKTPPGFSAWNTPRKVLRWSSRWCIISTIKAQSKLSGLNVRFSQSPSTHVTRPSASFARALSSIAADESSPTASHPVRLASGIVHRPVPHPRSTSRFPFVSFPSAASFAIHQAMCGRSPFRTSSYTSEISP